MEAVLKTDDRNIFQSTAAAELSAALTVVEAALTRLWASVLELDHVGRDDNFFLLGGDSLRAAVLFAEVDRVFGVRLPMESVFDEGETVAGMARLIETLSRPRRDPARQHAESARGIEAVLSAAAPREMKYRPPLIEKRDLFAAAKLILLLAVACVPGRSRRAALCRKLAAGLIRLRPSRVDYLRTVVPLLARETDARELEIALLADDYAAVVGTWRDCLPWTEAQPARLRGGAHIEAALAAGRGAVLWNCPTGAAGRPGLRALAAMGAPIAQLRGHGHPYSRSRFAETFLNPLPNRLDERCLERAVIVHEDNTVEAIQMLGAHLNANGVVRMSANGAFAKACEVPFFGGTLCLALGAPMLALLHGAPLIPLFPVPDGAGGYELIAEAPLTDGSEEPSLERARSLAREYAVILESYLKRNPHVWRCWFIPNTWRPAGGGGARDA